MTCFNYCLATVDEMKGHTPGYAQEYIMEEMYGQLEAFTPQELQMLEEAQTLEKMQWKAKQNQHRAHHLPTDKS